MKLLRMFRVCGVGRTLPAGTMSVIATDDDRRRIVYVPDIATIDRWDFVFDRFEVTSEMSSEPGAVGTLTAYDLDRGDGAQPRRIDGYFFKELPVTGEKIVQTVSVIGQGPRIRTE